ncbi:LemA family protein [candidate division GN15 bacterium]|nr:LemA family protein [candidate division GN15 bacterium]
MLWGIIALGVIVLLAFTLIGIYNRLVRLRNTVRSSWSDIDVQLKKRYNLIPSLVETVKGYAKHEKELLEKITAARAGAMAAATPGETAQQEQQLVAGLRGLMVAVEAYPDLKANQNFLDLQNQLAKIEDDIEAARRYYNAVVRDYNTSIETFPAVMFAAMLGFKPEDFFELDDAATVRKPIRPDFS